MKGDETVTTDDINDIHDFDCWFSHDVTKIGATKLLILLGFYLNDI